MSASLALQYVVVALAVLASCGVVGVKQFPGATRRLRMALAIALLRDGRPGWLRWLGRLVAPPVLAEGDCGSCNSCGPPPAR
jgi:hypothetical protein